MQNVTFLKNIFFYHSADRQVEVLQAADSAGQ